MPNVVMRESAGRILIELSGSAGPLFDAYRKACAGAKFDGPPNNTWSTDAETAMRICGKLADIGFTVILTPETRRLLEGEVADATASIEAARARLVEIDKRLAKKGRSLFTFQKLGIVWMSSRKKLVNCDDMGLGKAQPVDEPVLTPRGFVPIGSLKVGDFVVGANGKPVRVEGVYPQGVRTVYEVKFSDGASTRSCNEHLWGVHTFNDLQRGGRMRVLPLSEIRRKLRCKSNWTYYVPVAPAVEMESRSVSLDAYMLGFLIGDGFFGGGTPLVSSMDEEVLEYIRRQLPTELTLKRGSVDVARCDYRISQRAVPPQKGGNVVLNSLKHYKLMGCNSFTVFVPEDYKNNSADVRLAVLQGLMDSDGTVSKDSMVIEFNSASERLAGDVIWLVRSLGGAVKYSTRISASGSIDHRVRLMMPVGMCPFRLKRKVARYKDRTKYLPIRMIVGVEEAGEADTVCIRVASEDGLYVTKDFAVTHNTSQSLCSLPNQACTGVLVICPSIAKGVWKREAAIWRDDYRVTVLSGKKSFRWPEQGEIVVINYDVLPATPPPAPKGMELVLVADEAHYLKNYKSQRTQKVAAIAALADRRIFLTGTPLPSRPVDLWSVLQVAGVEREAFQSWKEFCRLFNGRKNPFGGMTWGKPLPEVGELLKPVLIRRLKKDVLKDLPDKMYRVLEVEISAEVEKKLDAEIKSLGPEVWLAREISEIPFDKMAKTRALLAKSKEDAAIEVIETYEEANEPLVVFSAHRYVIDRLAGREGWAVITGDVKSKERTAIEEKFQRGELRGVAATIGAASTALTLTRASHALYVDLSWVPADNSQSEDRIYRIGTTKGVLITHMVSQHALDQHVRNLIAKKMGIIEASVEKARGNKEVSIEQIAALVPKPTPVLVDKPGDPRRGARTPEEERAAKVLMTVGGMCDGAASKDNKGFSVTNARMGRGLALELLATGRLTESQWRTALWYGRSYRKQAGL